MVSNEVLIKRSGGIFGNLLALEIARSILITDLRSVSWQSSSQGFSPVSSVSELVHDQPVFLSLWGFFCLFVHFYWLVWCSPVLNRLAEKLDWRCSGFSHLPWFTQVAW